MINFKEIKKNTFKKENFYFLIVILFTFSVDRYSKIEIINNFSDRNFYINDFLNFDLIWNTGIGFGLLSYDSSIAYNLISSLIGLVILLLFYITFCSTNNEKFIYSLIIGGACGNFYDRLTFNAVPDYIDLHYKDFHWFTFNVADIFITLGILSFILKGYFIKN